MRMSKEYAIWVAGWKPEAFGDTWKGRGADLVDELARAPGEWIALCDCCDPNEEAGK
jgi:hypothetical protein